jgi:hypothetical protein
VASCMKWHDSVTLKRRAAQSDMRRPPRKLLVLSYLLLAMCKGTFVQDRALPDRRLHVRTHREVLGLHKYNIWWSACGSFQRGQYEMKRDAADVQHMFCTMHHAACSSSTAWWHCP